MIMSEDRDNIKELLSAYIDQEVTDEQSESIKQAVATDPGLAMELHELKAARRLLAGLPVERAPRGFVRRVMARAERKHLLGDHHAGGRFAAARWITLAVAATVLLAAGIGIIAINRLRSNRHNPTIISRVDEGGDATGGVKEGIVGHRGISEKGGLRTGKGGSGDLAASVTNGGGRLVIADKAFDYAVANARNASIYTHNVSDTLAVLNETLRRNDVQPLELDAPVMKSKASEPTADKKAEVSRGELNFYYNKKQDPEQVQIVVLASDHVIEQLNGDLNRIAESQVVSQAPVPDQPYGSSAQGYAARRAGPTKKRDDLRQNDPDMIAGTVGAGVSDAEHAVVGKAARGRAKSKVAAKDVGGDGLAIAKGVDAPAPTEPATTPRAVKAPKPADEKQPAIGEIVMVPPGAATPEPDDPSGSAAKRATKSLSETDVAGQSSGGTLGGSEVQVAANVRPVRPTATPAARPTPAKPAVNGPTTRPAETVAIAGVQQERHENSGREGGKELETLSKQIAADQQGGRSGRKLDAQYNKLNSAFRQQIVNDNILRNVQSQRALGVNVQALVININRRSLRGLNLPATRGALLRARGGGSRPAPVSETAPAPESTTQKAAQQSEMGR